MAEKAYKITDSRGKESVYWFGQANNLIQAARQNDQRKYIPPLDRDIHRNVSNFGRRELLSAGRKLYSNNPIVRGAIEEMALFSSSIFTPQFDGSDKEWGKTAEAWLAEHDKICDVAGWNYDMAQYRRQLIISVLRDGDIGTLLTETSGGYPKLQTVPAHRIGSRFYFGALTGGIGISSGNEVVDGGNYDGARIIDGVIIDDYGTAIAYRIADEASDTGFRDVGAESMFLSFIPEYTGQLRGFSQLGSEIYTWIDIGESRGLTLTRMKLAASIGLIEKNETGEVDQGRALLGSVANLTNSDGRVPNLDTNALVQMRTERMDGVINRFFRAGTGSSLEFLENNNPTLNEREFEKELIRCALQGLGWSYDFSLNPTEMGGQNGRVVVLKINRRIRQLQDMIIRPAVRRFDGYRIAKAQKLSLLPASSEWWMWDYQTAAQLTSDEKYSSDVAIQEFKAGFRTKRDICAERGEYFEDVANRRLEETKAIFAQAKALSTQFGCSFEFALTHLSETGSTNVSTTVAPDQQTAA